jgi:hypothetical protein
MLNEVMKMQEIFEIRTEVEDALRKAGIEVTGAGTGADGTADISIKIDGKDVWIDLRKMNS